MKKMLFVGLMFLGIGSAKAANFGDLVAISTQTRTQNRCNYALQTAAVAVMAESANTAGHSARVQYARTILSSSVSNMAQITIDVLTNSTIAAEANLAITPDYAVPDTDIQFAVNSIFNALAGIAN